MDFGTTRLGRETKVEFGLHAMKEGMSGAHANGIGVAKQLGNNMIPLTTARLALVIGEEGTASSCTHCLGSRRING